MPVTELGYLEHENMWSVNGLSLLLCTEEVYAHLSRGFDRDESTPGVFTKSGQNT